MIISLPRLPEDHPDRALECQLSLEPAFQDLVRQAVAAGWTEADVAAAMIDLAHNHLKGILAHWRTQADVYRAEWTDQPNAPEPESDD
ncbi:hypothetical protein [Aureimonas glaciei]|uniref:Uncharacterized protein n=1 Tax=Aureimonas glaciei TaxID=1776957 RepID=A0A916Y069_9HYPH|nr:hypothetical protein [Aureimonas glaciei]GGD24535.1 hypothetical protein GCM10011335_29310 [Aureimonas glaciei]